MNFNNHSNLEGQHAFLGASKYHWINYSEDKVADAYSKFLATQKGTVLHAFAAQCISLGQKLPKSQKTLNMYVNDAIGYKMTPEQTLFYSENCFGTADSISYRSAHFSSKSLCSQVLQYFSKSTSKYTFSIKHLSFIWYLFYISARSSD